MSDEFSLSVRVFVDRFGILKRDPVSGFNTYSIDHRRNLALMVNQPAAEEIMHSRSLQEPFPAGRLLSGWIMEHPEEVRDKVVIDVGSGSGIMAIAAAKAGAKEVYALDIDPVAAELIRRNAAANDVSNITIITGDACDRSHYVGKDVITAADTFTGEQAEQIEKRLLVEFDHGKTVIVGSNLESMGMLTRQRRAQALHPSKENLLPVPGTYLLLKPAA